MKHVFFVAVALLIAQTAAAEVSTYISKYTRLTKCRVIQTTNDFMEEECESNDGYKVYLQSGDTRSWLVLKKGDREMDLQGTGEGDLYFPMIGGDKLEWRYRTLGGDKELVALIVRITGGEPAAYDKGIIKSASFLYVFRITGNRYCLLSKTTRNDTARSQADNPDLQCPKKY